MLRKLASALIATLVIGSTVISSTAPASAAPFIYRHGGGWGYGHRWYGGGGWGWGGPAAAGFLGGAILGSALAPRYYYGGPAYGYGEPSCYVRRQRIFDGYQWRIRRVEVCD